MKPSVLVIGLGRFGTAAALELMALGHEVLALDHDEATVNEIAPDVTHAAQLDATDEDALQVGRRRRLRVRDRRDQQRHGREHLRDDGAQEPGRLHRSSPRPRPTLHGAILERVGADRVVYPESEMGQRVAHSLSISASLDYLDVAPRFGIVKLRPPATWVGRSLKELDLGSCRRSARSRCAAARTSRSTRQHDVVIDGEDELILLGRDEQLERHRPLGETGAAPDPGSAQEEVQARRHRARDQHDDVGRQEQQPGHAGAAGRSRP